MYKYNSQERGNLLLIGTKNCDRLEMCLSLPNNLINIGKRRRRRNGNDEKESKGLLGKEIDRWKKHQQEMMITQEQDQVNSSNPTH